MREENKRNFRRYTTDSECEVRMNSSTYKGKVVDYAEGVGVIIKNIPQIVRGARADITILDYDIEFRAEIVSTVDLGYHLRAGFKRLDNLKGNLEYYSLADILIGISKSRKTGILEIITGSVIKRIYIKNGNKIFAASTNKNDRLGEYLLKQGKVTYEELDKASSLVSERGQRLGTVLVDLGYLDKSDLSQAVQHQVEEIILSLFNIDEGSFEFEEGPLPADEEITLDISTATLIYKGIKRINSISMVEKMSPPPDTAFNLSQNPLQLFKSLTLEFSDKKILSYIDGINTLKAIITLSPSSKFETLRTIITLLTIGLIHIKGKDEAPATPPLEMIFGEPAKGASEELLEKMPEEEERVTAEFEEEIRAKAEAEARAKVEEEIRAKAEAEARAIRAKAEAEARARVEEEIRAKAEAEARARVEEEIRAKAEAEARAKVEEEIRAETEEEDKAKAEEDAEAEAKAKEEAKAKAEAEARIKAEEEARAQVEEESRAKAEAEVRAKAEEDAKAEAEEDAKAKAEEEAKAKAEEEAKAKAEAEARVKAEEEVKVKAEAAAGSKKKMVYVSVVLSVIVLLGVIVTLKYNDIKSIFSPAPVPGTNKTEQAAGKTESPPPPKDEDIVEEPIDIHERTTPFPVFREDALRKVLDE
jgi:hypothetical protein